MGIQCARNSSSTPAIGPGAVGATTTEAKASWRWTDGARAQLKAIPQRSPPFAKSAKGRPPKIFFALCHPPDVVLTRVLYSRRVPVLKNPMRTRPPKIFFQCATRGMRLSIIFTLLLIINPTGTSGQCASCEKATVSNAAEYHVVVKYREADGTVVIHIYTEHSGFDREHMMELACRLHRDFNEEQNIFILVFDTKIAAKKYVPPSSRHKPTDWKNYAKSFRAFFSWKESGIHSIVWGFDPLLEISEIDVAKVSILDLCPNP